MAWPIYLDNAIYIKREREIEGETQRHRVDCVCVTWVRVVLRVDG